MDASWFKCSDFWSFAKLEIWDCELSQALILQEQIIINRSAGGIRWIQFHNRQGSQCLFMKMMRLSWGSKASLCLCSLKALDGSGWWCIDSNQVSMVLTRSKLLPKFFWRWLMQRNHRETKQQERSAPLAFGRLKREVAGLNEVHFGPKGGLYRFGKRGQKIYLKRTERLAAWALLVIRSNYKPLLICHFQKSKIVESKLLFMTR